MARSHIAFIYGTLLVADATTVMIAALGCISYDVTDASRALTYEACLLALTCISTSEPVRG